MFKKSYYYPFPLEIMKQDLLGNSGVFLIKNEINGNSYIGSAISKTPRHNRLYFKFRNHFFNSHKLTNIHLHQAMLKYGLNKFSFHILALTNLQKVRELETLYILHLSPKYNLLDLGTDELSEILTNDSKSPYFEKRRNILNNGFTLFSDTNLMMLQSTPLKKKEIRIIPSKKVEVYDGQSGKLLNILPSAIQVSRDYSINYRTVKKYLKSGLVYKNLNIRIKYYL